MNYSKSLDKLSKCKALTEIQREFKIIYNPINRFYDDNKINLRYGFFRTGRPFTLKSVKYMFQNQKDRIMKIIYDEKIDMNKFSTGLAIKSYISLKPKYIEYEDVDEYTIIEQDTKCIRFDESNLDNLLERFSNSFLKKLEEKDVIGIQAFAFDIVCFEKYHVKNKTPKDT